MIYATPFDEHTLQCTGPSVDSGFKSLADVVAAMGPPRSQSPQTVVYPGVIFSRMVWHA